MKPSLAAVIPAAGLSRRMGRDKVLLPFGSSTVLDTILGKLTQAGIGPVVIVSRPDLACAGASARRWNARVVINEHPEDEMLVSIQLGVAALPAAIDAFFLWPADHPAVSPSTIARLASAADAAHAAIPSHGGRRGHPALVGADLRAAIRQIPAGEGLRHLWRTHPELVQEVVVDDPGVLADLDTPGEYEAALRAHLRTGGNGDGETG